MGFSLWTNKIFFHFLQVEYNNKLFEIKLDVTDFEPSDLKVKIAGDRLSVSGKHSEKKDEHGFISREFTRQFVIPEVGSVNFKQCYILIGCIMSHAKIIHIIHLSMLHSSRALHQ